MRYLAACVVGAALTIVSLEAANYCADQYAATGVAPWWTLDHAADTAVLAVAAMCYAGLLQVRAILREMRKERTR